MFNPLNFISKFIKSGNKKELDRIGKIVDQINLLEENIKRLNDKEFPEKTIKLKEKIQKGASLNEILPEAFALVREASLRSRNERHFDVQIIGGVVLHENKIAEMRTGEGKTLTIALAAYLNALEGKGVHIVTVNDYLAKRDSLEMGKIFSFLGLTSGYINNDQNDEERKKNYDCDITYATNSELGFDYLRDNMKYSKDEMVQRGHHFAIVDEIDSCLIDEARTPLVISGAAEDKTNQYIAVDKVIKLLNKNDFEVDEKDRNILLTNEGINHIESLFSNAGVLKNNNFYDPENLDLVHFVNQSLKANHLFKKDKDYLVKDNSIKIVDELTGRILEGRRFGDGLHQAIEAKEKIEIQAENQTLASITYQNYFKLYKKISGCTGTAATESEEFFEIYNLNVIVIPTNKEMIRKDFNDQIFRTEAEKNDAIIKKIKDCHENSQPLLVFTSSVSKSEIYSKLLTQEKIKHTVLNAKNHENEAEIIANAGKAKSVIITTSISGRGVDIQLGGKKGSIEDNQLKKNKDYIKSIGGLFVIGTERMESRRVDNQARGRSGRQGDEGSSIFYVSLEDDLMRIFGSESMNNILQKLGLKDGESIDHPWINKALERAQQKVEARNFDIRKTLIKFDNVLNDQRHVIFSQRKDAMDSEKIFDYSDNFLSEIVDNIISLKIQKLSNPKNNEFSNRLKTIFGKSLNDNEYDELISLSDAKLREKIFEKFKFAREERSKILGVNQSKELEKRILLQSIDFNWKSHIQYLEQLRQVVGLRSYGQRDPLIEYKKEAFDLFSNLLDKLKLDYVKILMNLKVYNEPTEEINQRQLKEKFKNLNKKTSRNDPCPCGSGKKFKKCCGAL
ncbi:preprotein translocase subunit SecA [Candidatus Pelagibacter sp. RS39]|uniref:preprotein translocase subunit SecA n=1 Tax=Candidatus Pelagibacter sp. RS39 TaxID=1977864 RepID=UPI000A15B61E|nr:preprotein translocase subunit SecA [Candidatus Pelagibacter sp. RS39]ARJ47458.1 preprotein translocase subunit SecA [Candidatus Pelagibacter sp. RS39]